MKQSWLLIGQLFGIWLLLSGYFLPMTLALGLLSCLFVWRVSTRMDQADGLHHRGNVNVIAWIRYLGWLAVEIVKSNIDVARRVLSPGLPISPTILNVPASQATEFGRVIYANSITLTPGTVSIDVGEREIEVHALTKEAAISLAAGEMDRRIRNIEKTN